LLAHRFGFKCETCAESAPCPLTAAAAEPRPKQLQTRETTLAAAECASEIVPCEQCASGAPCPQLGAFEDLRVGASHPDLPGLGDETRAPESDLKLAYVWRSLCRRALWQYAGAAIVSVKDSGADEPASKALQDGQMQSPGPTSGPWKLPQEQDPQVQELRGGQALRRIAPERLALHRRAHSCWLAADGKVFDATLFLQRHPAGAEVILKYAGSDCSDDLGLHSKGAQKLWHKYCIAMLADGSFLGRGGRRLACTGKAFPCAQCSTAKEPCPDQSEGGVRRRSLDDTG